MIHEQLHSLTHRIPGVPAHDDRSEAPARHHHGHAGRRNPGHAHPAAHPTREPRVLVRWQRWIASLTR